MNSYYDIDGILTDEQRAPCTFEIDAPGLGFLDGNPGGDIKKGTQVNLPLWLGGYLAVQNFGRPVLSIDLPKSISPRVLNALKADPRTVDLRAQAPHFYDVAARALELFEEDEIVNVLLDTFKARAALITDHAHNTQGAIGADFLRGLDERERQLFRVSHDSAKSVRVWMGESRGESKIS